jgi:hypothetical protein
MGFTKGGPKNNRFFIMLPPPLEAVFTVNLFIRPTNASVTYACGIAFVAEASCLGVDHSTAIGSLLTVYTFVEFHVPVAGQSLAFLPSLSHVAANAGPQLKYED